LLVSAAWFKSGSHAQTQRHPIPLSLATQNCADVKEKRCRYGDFVKLAKPSSCLSQGDHLNGRRSLVETAMYRYKTIIGRRLHARTLPNQKTEAKIACNALNRMTSLGMPISVRIKCDASLKGRCNPIVFMHQS